ADYDNPQSAAMGEGIGDFVSLHALLREEDDPAATYGVGAYANHSSLDYAYYGIRRTAYSTDVTKNGLLYEHLVHGSAGPTAAPFAPNANPNYQVHNAGEVWATMLFDAYGAVLARRPFAEAKQVFAEYFVEGLALQPTSATFTEARDALLLAIVNHDADDAKAVAEAFARRGLGSCAVSPDREAESFDGLVSSFELRANVHVAGSTFRELAPSCDEDGILDAGEDGVLDVTLSNDGFVDATATLVVTSTNGALALSGEPLEVLVPARGTAELAIPVRLSPTVT